MADDTTNPKPWDLEQFRGVRRLSERKNDWEQGRELILDDRYRTDRLASAKPKFETKGPSLFWLALKTAILTVITLGFYRFWMVTSLRRHYWNSIHIQGDPLEYTGTGLEKILGFLVAIIILAVYLGLVNIGLTFAGMSLLSDEPLALNISILAAIPLFFFAGYRARRYIMARTRWRGIRFGMDNGAWGYTIRAMWHWVLTLATGGLLYPYQQFKLAKYMTDRTYFGDMKLQQNGSWVGLFAYWVWLYIALGMIGLAIWGIAADPGNPTTSVIAGTIIFIGYMSLFIMFMRYEVVAFCYMWSNRTLGDTSFYNDISPGKIISVYVVGSLLVGLCTILVGLALIAITVAAGIYLQDAAPLDQLAKLQAELAKAANGSDPVKSLPLIVLMVVIFYLVFFAIAYAFTQVFITQPILQRKVEAMVINEARALAFSRQREHDHAAEAGGFADALGVDVGAGF